MLHGLEGVHGHAMKGHAIFPFLVRPMAFPVKILLLSNITIMI